MSIRYGVSLTLDPAFTAGLHRVRQVICSQYGCWAAEMHSVHLPLTDYFPCTEDAVPSITSELEDIAAGFRKRELYAFVERSRLVADTHGRGDIFLEMADANQLPAGGGSRLVGRGRSGSQPRFMPTEQLRSEIAAALGRWHISAVEERDGIRFGLLLCSDLPPQVFARAVAFAEGVFSGVDMAMQCYLSDLTFFRYESTAAGEDWSGGGWASDLSWKIVGSYSLLPGQNP